MNMSSSPAPSNSSIYSNTPNVAAISSLDASSCPSRPGAALAEARRPCNQCATQRSHASCRDAPHCHSRRHACARDQDVAKVEDARHTRTQGGVQMPACPLERCPPRQARPLCAPFLRLRTPITHLSSVAFASSSSCSHSPYHPHGSRLHRSTRPLEYTPPDRRQGCALRHGRRTSLALIASRTPSPFSNATPRS